MATYSATFNAFTSSYDRLAERSSEVAQGANVYVHNRVAQRLTGFKRYRVKKSIGSIRGHFKEIAIFYYDGVSCFGHYFLAVKGVGGGNRSVSNCSVFGCTKNLHINSQDSRDSCHKEFSIHNNLQIGG